MPPKPGGDDWVAVCELQDLGKAGADVWGKKALMLKIFLGFALSLEAGWVAGFHIDADDVSCHIPWSSRGRSGRVRHRPSERHLED